MYFSEEHAWDLYVNTTANPTFSGFEDYCDLNIIIIIKED